MSIGIVGQHSKYGGNIEISTGKKPIVPVTYENEKNSFPYLKCVSRLSCVVHGPIYTATHKTAPINRPLDYTGET